MVKTIAAIVPIIIFLIIISALLRIILCE
jgi:hypothetical protein